MKQYLGKMFIFHLPAAFQNRQTKGVGICGVCRGAKTQHTNTQLFRKSFVPLTDMLWDIISRYY